MGEAEQASHYREVDARARAILETEDFTASYGRAARARGRRADASGEKRTGENQRGEAAMRPASLMYLTVHSCVNDCIH
jgi:hypothetical protein